MTRFGWLFGVVLLAAIAFIGWTANSPEDVQVVDARLAGGSTDSLSYSADRYKEASGKPLPKSWAMWDECERVEVVRFEESERIANDLRERSEVVLEKTVELREDQCYKIPRSSITGIAVSYQGTLVVTPKNRGFDLGIGQDYIGLVPNQAMRTEDRKFTVPRVVDEIKVVIPTGGRLVATVKLYALR